VLTARRGDYVPGCDKLAQLIDARAALVATQQQRQYIKHSPS
jgi:hypothetical protein